jgi:anti-sigma regulatory factor (Ser/Thr protein kinase)
VAFGLATRLGFDEVGGGKAAIIAQELASNLVKHARAGMVLLRPLEQNQVGGLEILALDKGPGIGNVGHCLRDGFSTAGTPGTGLGAVSRLASSWDIHSCSGKGTALVARLWRHLPRAGGRTRRWQAGVVSIPKDGEVVCGDAWEVASDGGRDWAMVADGLGHGPGAADAAQMAVRVFRENLQSEPVGILRLIHAALQSTRGAAAAAAVVDLERETVRFAGVGNIGAVVWSAGAGRNLVSHNGTLGHKLNKVQEFDYPFPRGALLVMHSDGLVSRWGLDEYPGLAAKDPSLAAGVLYRDFQRGRDDVTVLAAREVAEGDAGT